MLKALIFDFDGVLVLSEGSRQRVISEILTAHGIAIPHNIKALLQGRTSQKFLEAFLPDNLELASQILHEFKTKYVQNIIDYTKPISFTLDYIRNYKGKLTIAIASMSSLKSIQLLTKHFGIFEKISLIVSRDEVTHHKPHPEVYLKTAEKLGVSPSECMVFEDSVVGVQAALDAKMRCSIILNGTNTIEELEGLPVYAFVSNEAELNNMIIGA